MKLLTHIALIAMLAIVTACSNNGQDSRKGQQPDDRYTYEYVKKISVTQPKQALQLLRTAEERKTMPELDINVLRGIVYYNSMLNYNKARAYTEAALRDPNINKHPDRLLETLHIAALVYYNHGDYANCLKVTERGIAEAYKHDDRKLMAKLMTVLGQCNYETGNPSHAVNCYDRAIVILNGENKNAQEWKNYYDLVTAYALKANTLLETKQYARLFEARPGYEAALRKLNAMPESISGVNDIANATFYSIYAIGYEESGDHDMGNDMYGKLIGTRAASTPEGATFVVPYLMLRKQYAEALKKENEMEAVWRRSGKDTVDYNYTHMVLMNKARTLQALGRYKEAIETGMKAYVLADSLNKRVKRDNATWMSEQLGKDVLKKYINRQDKILRASGTANIIIVTLLAVCVILITIVLRANRKLKAKNQATSYLVRELLTYKRQVMDHLHERRKAKEGETPEDDADNDDLPDHEEFLRMEKMVTARRLFVRPRLERADVANEMGTSVANFNALFSAYCKLSFNNYINDLRMEYAARLLKEKPNYTIEAIGTECGVPIRQTFHRLFVKKFGMTPAEYRKSMEEE